MDPPKYNGTMHPEEWIQQVQASCYKTDYNEYEPNVVKLCKKLIHPIIKIPSIENISTYDGLLKALKAHISFTIFKESCKRKLLVLKYIPEKDGGDTAIFLANFQSLCYNAEINNIEEIKSVIYRIMISNDFFKREFLKKSEKITSMEELLKLFNDFTIDEANLISSGSRIAIKHAVTGKYLSSVSDLNYNTGTGNQAVFAGKTSLELNVLWTIYTSQINRFPIASGFVHYDNNIYLYHMSCRELQSSYNSRSNNSEVNCRIKGSQECIIWKLKQYNSTNNCDKYIKSQDRIVLQDNNNNILRSHEIEFNLNNKTLQEVALHNGRIGGNDEWIIELIEGHVYRYLCDTDSLNLSRNFLRFYLSL